MNNIDWGYLFGMALQTVPEPRKVARDVFAFSASRRALWLILALVLVAMAFLAVISSILFPVDPAPAGLLFANPVVTGGVQAVSAWLMVYAIFWIGGALGGTGGFNQALLTVIWLHFVLLILQLGVIVLGLFAPGMALVLTVMSIAMTFWLLSHFVAEMHGFASAGAVFVGILMVLMVVAVVLSLLLAIFGIAVGLETGPGGA